MRDTRALFEAEGRLKNLLTRGIVSSRQTHSKDHPVLRGDESDGFFFLFTVRRISEVEKRKNISGNKCLDVST